MGWVNVFHMTVEVVSSIWIQTTTVVFVEHTDKKLKRMGFSNGSTPFINSKNQYV